MTSLLFCCAKTKRPQMLPSAAFGDLGLSERSALHQPLGRRQAHALPCRYSAAHKGGLVHKGCVHTASMPFRPIQVKRYRPCDLHSLNQGVRERHAPTMVEWRRLPPSLAMDLNRLFPPNVALIVAQAWMWRTPLRNEEEKLIEGAVAKRQREFRAGPSSAPRRTPGTPLAKRLSGQHYPLSRPLSRGLCR